MWHLPSAPDFRGGQPHLCILAGQTAVVGSKQIATLRLRHVRQIRLPGIRVKNRSTALIEPLRSCRRNRKMPRRISSVTRSGWLSAYARANVADNTVFLGVEKATLLWLRATAGTAVEKHYRLSVGLATLLKVQFMDGRDSQAVRVVRLDRRIEPANGIFHRGN